MKLHGKIFAPVRHSKPTSQGQAGYDNPRENIDPHIKTKVVSSREGSIEKVPINGHDIVNKTYCDSNIISPAGADSQIQYNNSGSFGGDADLVWDDTNKRFIIKYSGTSALNQGRLEIVGNTSNNQTIFYAHSGNATYPYSGLKLTTIGHEGSFELVNAYGTTKGKLSSYYDSYLTSVKAGGMQFGINITTLEGVLHIAKGGTGFSTSMYIDCYSVTNASQSLISFRKSSSNTIGTKAVTANDEDIGYLGFTGVNSSGDWANCASMLVEQEGNAGATYLGGRYIFYTGTNTAAPTERLRIDSSGVVTIANKTLTDNLSVTKQTLHGVTAITTTQTISDNSSDLYTVDDSVGTVGYTITLPSAVSNTGRILYFVRVDLTASTVTLAGTLMETINGAATNTHLAAQYKAISIFSDGTQWLILNTQ